MNLLPAASQKKMRRELRARFFLAFSLVVLGGAALSALALAPAEASILLFSPPSSQAAEGAGNPSEDTAAAGQTKSLLAAVQPFIATSSLDDVLAALSQQGPGIRINDISYSPVARTIAIAGTASAPSNINTFRQDLQSDLRFTNVSVPVAALLGSQNGDFTITMKVSQ